MFFFVKCFSPCQVQSVGFSMLVTACFYLEKPLISELVQRFSFSLSRSLTQSQDVSDADMLMALYQVCRLNIEIAEG